jgi:broad specificity phosphatase PhoE
MAVDPLVEPAVSVMVVCHDAVGRVLLAAARDEPRTWTPAQGRWSTASRVRPP